MKLWEEMKLKEEALEVLQEENLKLHEEINELKEKARLTNLKEKARLTNLKEYLELYLESFTKEEITTTIKILSRIPLGYFKDKDITYLLKDLREML